MVLSFSQSGAAPTDSPILRWVDIDMAQSGLSPWRTWRSRELEGLWPPSEAIQWWRASPERIADEPQRLDNLLALHSSFCSLEVSGRVLGRLWSNRLPDGMGVVLAIGH